MARAKKWAEPRSDPDVGFDVLIERRTVAQLPDKLWRLLAELTFIRWHLGPTKTFNTGELAWLLHRKAQDVDSDLDDLEAAGFKSILREVLLPWMYVDGPEPELVEPEPPPSTDGLVYIIAGGGYYKIGMTTNLDRRLPALSIAVPFELELVHKVETSQPRELEFYFHQYFSGQRVNGEWFKLSDDDLEYIREFDPAELEAANA